MATRRRGRPIVSRLGADLCATSLAMEAAICGGAGGRLLKTRNSELGTKYALGNERGGEGGAGEGVGLRARLAARPAARRRHAALLVRRRRDLSRDPRRGPHGRLLRLDQERGQ